MLGRVDLAGWWLVVKAEGKRVNWLKMGWALARPWRWRKQAAVDQCLEACRVCPVFDSILDRCGPEDVKGAGCRCHCPTLALFGGECWWKRNGGIDRWHGL